MFVRNDLVGKKIKSCRLASKKFQEFKKKLGLDPYKVNFDEQEIIGTFPNVFEGGIILTEFIVNNNRIDAYFPKYKIRIEIDEYDHEGTNSDYEQGRQLMIESNGISIIRTNPDDPDFDINRLIYFFVFFVFLYHFAMITEIKVL